MRKSDKDVKYETVVDLNLAHGECDLTPDLVAKEVQEKPWQEESRYRYGTDHLNPEGEEIESIYDVNDAPLPIRAMIVRKMFLESGVHKPWKTWIESVHGKGWLVVSDSGWKFFPQKTRKG